MHCLQRAQSWSSNTGECVSMPALAVYQRNRIGLANVSVHYMQNDHNITQVSTKIHSGQSSYLHIESLRPQKHQQKFLTHEIFRTTLHCLLHGCRSRSLLGFRDHPFQNLLQGLFLRESEWRYKKKNRKKIKETHSKWLIGYRVNCLIG